MTSAVAKRVILHVGAPKTGTSYLESIMWSQRDRLERDGIFLPGTSRRAHDALMGDVRGGVWAHPRSPWTWDRLVEVVHGRDDTVLVSKEMLAGARADQAERAVARLGDVQVHIVVTARHLAGSLPSAWQQGVKGRATVPFSAWLAALQDDPEHGFWRHQDPMSILRRWAADLPAEQVHVITMPRDSRDPSELWRRFAGVIGVDPATYDTPVRPNNASIGAVEIELLRRVNAALGRELPMRVPYLSAVKRYLTDPVLGAGTERHRLRFGVPAEYQGWMEQRAQQMVSELQAYPCQIVGDLVDLQPAPSQGLISPDDVTDAQIAECAVGAIAELLVHARERDQLAVALAAASGHQGARPLWRRAAGIVRRKLVA